MNAQEIIDRLGAIRTARAPIGYDLEGSQFVSCQAFAETPHRAFCVVTDSLGSDSQRVWEAIIGVLTDPLVPKWTWNAHHELAVLKHAHGITLANFEDAMALWFELYPERRKSLKYVASLLTRQPCWTTGISWDEDDEDALAVQHTEEFYRYNATDAAVTLEIALHPTLQAALRNPVIAERYALRKRLIAALTWSSLHGIPYDTHVADSLRAELEPAMWAAQAEVDRIAGVTLPATEDELLAAAARRWCHAVKLRRYCLPTDPPPVLATAVPDTCTKDNPPGKRKSKVKPPPELLTWDSAATIAKLGGADALTAIRAAFERVASESGSVAAAGELASLLDITVNVKSTPTVIALLDRLGLPKVYRRGERGDPGARTKDADVLLDLYLRTGHPVTVALLKTIALRTQLQELDRQLDPDGKIRCSFISCGTETDRTTSKKWLTGAGGNLQTVPSKPVNFRKAYVPKRDETTAWDWWKFDYTGADAWTVAARCAVLGDATMLDDLRAGLRIPTLLGLALEGVPLHKYSRAELAAMCKSFVRDWRDLAFKRATYGTMYGMTPRGVRRVAVADSFRETGEPRDPGLALCDRIQHAMHSRYWGIARWHQWVCSCLKTSGRLTAASGLTREFYGRRIYSGVVDESTAKEAYAFEPQANTTYCLNRAVDALWTDPENRDESGEPVIQPLLVVHDEFDMRAPVHLRDWVEAKIRAAMAQPLNFGKLEITIPAVLARGTSWGDTEKLV